MYKQKQKHFTQDGYVLPTIAGNLQMMNLSAQKAFELCMETPFMIVGIVDYEDFGATIIFKDGSEYPLVHIERVHKC